MLCICPDLYAMKKVSEGVFAPPSADSFTKFLLTAFRRSINCLRVRSCVVCMRKVRNEKKKNLRKQVFVWGDIFLYDESFVC